MYHSQKIYADKSAALPVRMEHRYIRSMLPADLELSIDNQNDHTKYGYLDLSNNKMDAPVKYKVSIHPFYIIRFLVRSKSGIHIPFHDTFFLFYPHATIQIACLMPMTA